MYDGSYPIVQFRLDRLLVKIAGFKFVVSDLRILYNLKRLTRNLELRVEVRSGVSAVVVGALMIHAGHEKVVPSEEGLMKSLFIAISGMIILMNSMVYGQSDTQVIDSRQLNQEDWIERSFDRGQLDREQDRIDRRESRGKADGIVKRKEATRTGAAQKRASQPIVRERQDRRDARHR